VEVDEEGRWMRRKEEEEVVLVKRWEGA